MGTDLKPSTAGTPVAVTGPELIPCTQGGASKVTTPALIAALGVTAPVVDNAVSRFDGTAGKVQGSAVTLNDVSGSGAITISPRDTSGQVMQLGGTTGAFPGLYYYSTGSRLDINKADDSGMGLLGADTIWWLGSHGSTPRAEINSAGQIRTVLSLRFSSVATDCRSDDGGISRGGAAAVVSVDGPVAGDGLGLLKMGNGLRGVRRTSTAAGATTTEYPADGDIGCHVNTTTGAHHLVWRDGGALFSVQML